MKSSVNVIMVCVTLARTAAYYQPLWTLALRLQSTIILRSYKTLGNIRRGRSRGGGGSVRGREAEHRTCEKVRPEAFAAL